MNIHVSKDCNSFVISAINYHFRQRNIAEGVFVSPLHKKIFTMKLNSNFSNLTNSADLWQKVQLVERRLQELDEISTEIKLCQPYLTL